MSTHVNRINSAAAPQPAAPHIAAPAVRAQAEPVAARSALRHVAAALRLSLGWVFLWAFIDKLFALGFSTGRNPETGVVDRFGPDAWINGGSPTMGFLKFGTDGPLAGFYQGFAGAAWADWLFMIGLAGIGLALMLGIGMRLAAAAGTLLLVLMWSAVLPPANNPFIDDHLIYALALIALALMGAGRTWGFGKVWERIPFVQRHPVLK
ncbi:DoxX family membrane protein [Segeticoccus rhizosphaerae]|jgi:thiosulfate dehydrogenase [quinone] large subunit|uniref:DoxX family membrane protein n=1 Tax=Segeticoccus rhizosphaerae TaxID=1104777 RepID=UPI0010C11934|nr:MULTISPECIES: DoxX family membrane protein [Intrasporangiaceae]